MARDPDVWTGNVRRVLYDLLVKKFGPYDVWNRRSPGRDLDDEFKQFCEAFAFVVGAKSGKAVQHQIFFALPETTRGSTWEGQTQTAIMNKAAAMEAGFIEDKHLPKLLAIGRDSPGIQSQNDPNVQAA